MYIVTADHPFYPEVELFETLKEAKEEFSEMKDRLDSKEGQHECVLTIAVTLHTLEIKSDY